MGVRAAQGEQSVIMRPLSHGPKSPEMAPGRAVYLPGTYHLAPVLPEFPYSPLASSVVPAPGTFLRIRAQV